MVAYSIPAPWPVPLDRRPEDPVAFHKLTEILSAAVPAAPPIGVPVHRLVEELESAEPSGVFGRLLAQLGRDPRLNLFDGKMQVCGNVAVTTNYLGLAVWLIQRAQRASASEAVANLTAYVDADEFPCNVVMTLGGMLVRGRHDLGYDIELLSWQALPESDDKHETAKYFPGWPGPTAALVWRTRMRRMHVDEKSAGTIPTFSTQVMDDMLLCLGVRGPCAPHTLALWMAPPDSVPMFSRGLMFLGQGGGAPPRAWYGDPQDARRLFEMWQRIDDGRKVALRMPMQRLNLAIRRLSLADAAIDLGIALEGLFLRDLGPERGELGFRLRARAARFLGEDTDSRRRLERLFKDLYGCRSTAVHTGLLHGTYHGQDAKALLDSGFRETAAAIVKLIEKGEPDWDEVLLG